MVVRDGERRDSAWYAVIVDDWPGVRGRSKPGSRARLRRARYPLRNWSFRWSKSVNVIGRGRVGLGDCSAPGGARRRAARRGRRADAALRAGRGHSGRGPGTVPRAWLDRTCLGATPLSALDPHERRFSLHPMQTFTPARGPEQLDGAWAAVTAETDEAAGTGPGARADARARAVRARRRRPAALPRGRGDGLELPRHAARGGRLARRRGRRAARGARAADAPDDRERLRADRPDRARRLGDGGGAPRGDPRARPDLEPLYEALAEATAR